jgi:hypothetical protein
VGLFRWPDRLGYHPAGPIKQLGPRQTSPDSIWDIPVVDQFRAFTLDAQLSTFVDHRAPTTDLLRFDNALLAGALVFIPGREEQGVLTSAESPFDPFVGHTPAWPFQAWRSPLYR